MNYIRIQKIFTNLAVLFLRGNIEQSEMQAIKKGLIYNYLDLPCGVYGCLVVNVSKCSSCNPTLKDNLVVKPKAQRGQHACEEQHLLHPQTHQRLSLYLDLLQTH